MIRNEIKDKFTNVGEEVKKGGDGLIFDYLYEGQSEAFSFYRTPQVFYTDERFQGLTSDAKTLYGILLDRVSLSRKNGWRDDEGRVFVYMTVRSIETALGCAHQKACGLLAELEEFGLIERVKQHLCKPDRIYVKNFIQVWNSNARRYENHTLIILILIILNRVIPILSYPMRMRIRMWMRGKLTGSCCIDI